MRPCAILIEDDPLDTELERMTLTDAGFDVVWAGSIIEGEAKAHALLDPATPALPTVVILDLYMPHPSHPEIEGAILAAALTRRMILGTLNPALLVALTNYLNPEREEEALFAGCRWVLHKPLVPQQAHWLREQLHLTPQLVPDTVSPGVRLYQKKAEQILNILRRGQPFQDWTPEYVQILLSALTNYPPLDRPTQYEQTALLRSLGGQQATLDLLRTCSGYLDEPYAAILNAFLAGGNRRDIRAELVRMGYSRTHSYYCMNALPARVAACLRLRRPLINSYL